MRLFVAIPVPEEIKKYAYSLRSELDALAADVKWVEYENYHLTLKFLGDVGDDKLEKIRYGLICAAESSPPFTLKLSHLGFFPNHHRPRVLWIGVKGEMEKAYFLGDRVDAYLEELGFDREEKRTFHLTLGRIRSDLNQDKLVKKVYELSRNIEEHPFTVSNFLLMESFLHAGGPIYKVDSSFTLNG
ncbi:2'-5' RNA ligase [Thermosyntropha lipolytica DSM 11003]|uniref:RNA 2',3'-cyclic phosphodiesterase n=1 Tax=Thermosyntropha lipolytica DSM 11003 TaxID=1123382 RepID=A0A1M5QEV8_9FIRM|nr:RNA 2',3'-cyclic phosphodiesterase [Thermosyntropha lipolytica]SHH12567.1 2'-5' RNA ligase [Thermosyntropha lipolytica DSM 11003]